MRKPKTFKTGSFQEFKEFTLAVVRGKRKVDPREPKIWVESAPEAEPLLRLAFIHFSAFSYSLSPLSKIPRPVQEEGKRRGGCSLFCDRRDARVRAAATV
jgi:hypothetical protein